MRTSVPSIDVVMDWLGKSPEFVLCSDCISKLGVPMQSWLLWAFEGKEDGPFQFEGPEAGDAE